MIFPIRANDILYITAISVDSCLMYSYKGYMFTKDVHKLLVFLETFCIASNFTSLIILENIEILSGKSQFSSKDKRLCLGALCSLEKWFIRFFLAGTVSLRLDCLRAILGRVQPQEVAAMPTAVCSSPQICIKSPEHLWEVMEG